MLVIRTFVLQCHSQHHHQACGYDDNDYDYGEQALNMSMNMHRELVIPKKAIMLVKSFLVMKIGNWAVGLAMMVM